MRKKLWISLLAAIAVSAIAATAMAVHPTTGVVINHIVRGTLAEAVQSHNLGQDGVNVKTNGPVDVVTARITFNKGGGSAGWHTHPGPVFIVMISGTLSVWDEHCEKTTYSVGSALFEPGPRHSMLVKNESPTVDAVLYATFVVPVGAAPLTTRTEHLCGITD